MKVKNNILWANRGARQQYCQCSRAYCDMIIRENYKYINKMRVLSDEMRGLGDHTSKEDIEDWFNRVREVKSAYDREVSLLENELHKNDRFIKENS